MAHSIEWYEQPGKLSKVSGSNERRAVLIDQMMVDESQIPEDDRIPRFTSATWKYENGAIGHLEHGVALQGQDFSTELAVCKLTEIQVTPMLTPVCDGYQLKLIDPYNRPTLYVRRPGNDAEEIHTFHDDDAFFSEMATFIDMASK